MSLSRPNPLAAALAAFAVTVLVDAAPALGQATGTVTGEVREQGSRRPLESAQVFIPGSGQGALTNSAGRFLILNVPAGEVTVRVELIGYAATQQTTTVQAGESAMVSFELRQSMIELDQLVVTGAGVATERRRLGNTIAAIDALQLQNAPVANISEMLTAREPGVVGLPSGGLAGEGARIRIRGSASIAQTNEPVVYIDGVRVDNAGGFGPNVGAGGGGTPSRLDDINPDAIERIEILKGAAAATLYGTQASNGVIQIFTKRGQSGAPRYDLMVEQGFSRYPMDRFTRHAGFVTSQDGSSRDRGVVGVRDRWGISVQPYEVFEVDMHPALFETGHSQTYALSVTGGTPAVTYFLSGRYQTEDGPFGGTQLLAEGFRGGLDKNDRKQANAGITIFPLQDLRVRVTANYTEASHSVPDNNNNIFGVLSSLENSRPERAHAGNLFGSPAFATTREAIHRQATQEVQRFGGSLSANYQVTSSINLDGTFGVDIVNQQAIDFLPFGWNVDGFAASNANGFRFVDDRNHRELTIDAKGSWNTDLSESVSSSFLVGLQGFITQTRTTGGSGNDFPGRSLDVVGAGFIQTSFEQFLEEVNAGVFVQEQLGFNDFVFATVGARYDKHSAFGETQGGQLYPKVSLSVVPSDRPGWDSELLSTLRLRGAVGRSGLQPGAFDKFTTYDPLASQLGPGVAPANLGNADLAPEVSTEWEVGSELGVFSNRASIEFTYWNRTVSDALVPRQFAPTGGFRATQLVNIGEMKASGVEVGARASLVNRPGFSLNAFVNAAYLKEEVTDMGAAPPIKTGGAYPRYRNFVREGYAPGSFFGPHVLDVEYPIALSGDCTIADGAAPASREALLDYFSVPRSPDAIIVVVENCGGDILSNYLGKPHPDWQGSFGTNITLMDNVRVSTMFEYRFGNYVIHDLSGAFRRSHPLIGRNVRQSAEIESILINPASTAEQRLEAARVWATELKALSPFDGLNEIHQADWLRLREVSLTYSAPSRWADAIGARSLSLTAGGRNLLMWTKFPGVDPEQNVVSRADPGNDPGAIRDANFLEGTVGWGVPLPRRFTFSARVGF